MNTHEFGAGDNPSIEGEKDQPSIIRFRKTKDGLLMYIGDLPLISDSLKNTRIRLDVDESGERALLIGQKPNNEVLASFDASALVELDIPQEKNDVGITYGYIPFSDLFIRIKDVPQTLPTQEFYNRKEDVVNYITETLRKMSILCAILRIPLMRNEEIAQWTQELLSEKTLYSPEEYIDCILEHIDALLAGRKKESLPAALHDTSFSAIVAGAGLFDYKNQVLTLTLLPAMRLISVREYAKRKAIVSYFLLYCSLQDIDIDDAQELREALLDFPYGHRILEIYQVLYNENLPLTARDHVLLEVCRTAPRYEDYNFKSNEWTKNFRT
ncbi:hypothetical protein HY732_03880 [Candidatus Uhrbacteria bacterium]|nr:hypothetical protein [Candidatus Uhrbacteria bacterium]